MKVNLISVTLVLLVSVLPMGNGSATPTSLNCTSCQANFDCIYCGAVSGKPVAATCLPPLLSDCTALELEAPFFCPPEVFEVSLGCDACVSAGCTFCNPFRITGFPRATSETKCFCGEGTTFDCVTTDSFRVQVQECTDVLGCYECKERGCQFCRGAEYFGLRYPDRCDCSDIPTCLPFLSEQANYCDFFLEVGVYLVPGIGVPLLAFACIVYFKYFKQKPTVAETVEGRGPDGYVVAVYDKESHT